ncbi:acetyl-CoA synthetase-like protein [Karstenula rhodostoma CBS 690.94]|uniref:Acetyl-CoA synthetase-like protein n=1 Tax=Karstenula rhodostoma CBS 690.94 TaxID=1392251 RepID=A0A9P4PM00_9PLEO|nr:acetyl-CoA synthetase-like protein [Karstenula rhodostoma CBS 690.94]
MTEMQLSLVRSSQLHPGHNIIYYSETHLPDNVPTLKEAWRAVLASEPIFRTTIDFLDSGAYLVEGENATFDWDEIVVRDEFSHGIELQRMKIEGQYFGSSFRVVTIPGINGRGKSTVVWRVHHALVDDYSRGLILSKLDNFLAGKAIDQGPSFRQYSEDLLTLQRQFHDVGSLFWKKRREEHPRTVSKLMLPAALPSQAQRNTVGEVTLRLHDMDFRKMAAYCQTSGVTLGALYHAAWALVLSVYTNSNDVCFGTVLSGRTLPMDIILVVVGPTINLLPLCIAMDLGWSSLEFVRGVFNSLLRHNSLQWTSPQHGFARSFSSALNVLLEVPFTQQCTRNIIPPTEPPEQYVMSDIPLVLEISPDKTFRVKYHRDVYSEFQITPMVNLFSECLRLLQQPNLTIKACLDEASLTHRLYVSRVGNWSSPDTTVGSTGDDLLSLFTRVALQNPELIAVEQDSQTITYAELDVKSFIVSKRIAEFVSPGDVVVCRADRSINWIIGIYSILKAGAVYCPFDEGLPDRIRDANFVVAGARVFLVSTAAAKVTKPSLCTLCFSVDELLHNTETFSRPKPEERTPKPGAPAYLCFTSGSTGKPKGVLCRHRGLVAFQSDFEVRLRARPGWRIAQFMSPSFDGSIHEIFSALSYGATLVLPDRRNPFAHIHIVDAVILTPSVARMMEPSDFPALSTLYLVGEPAPQQVADKWSATRVVFNMYGPTEATCGATIKQLHWGRTVTLGIPNPSTRVYILGEDQRVLPLGVVGEIYLAGVQVAIGYVGDKEKTAERFVADSVNPHLDETMYRTGDKGYWNEDGELVFLGRSDRQVKLRGFRIELDDLEIRILRAIPTCSAVAITAMDGVLYAQVQPQNINVSTMRFQLREHIPQYAIPQHIRAVEQFPCTRAGKLDYNAIVSTMSLVKTLSSQDNSDVPESMMKAAVRHVLNLPEGASVDLGSTFYDMGGSSISQLSFSHRLSKICGQEISISTIMTSPSLRHLLTFFEASKLRDQGRTQIPLGDHDVSPIERDWWDKSECGGGSPAFNVTFACTLHPLLDKSRLVASWNHVLGRHRILRSRYYLSSSKTVCRKYGDVPIALEVPSIDIPHEIHRLFDLRNDNLVRVSISPTHIVVVISHIICDLATLRVLLGEVAVMYHGEQLPPVIATYSSIPLRLVNRENMSFWEDCLKDAPAADFPLIRNTPRETWEGSSIIRYFSAEAYLRMKTFAECRKVTMHQLVLAAVTLALQNDASACDMVLGAPYLSRHSEDCQDVVGLFLEPLPIRIRYPDAENQGASFLESVQRSSRAALLHAAPWNQLLTHLKISHRFPNHPLFEVMVSFHDQRDRITLAIPGAKRIPTWTQGAKFKLMVEFSTTLDEALELRLEYSTETFTQQYMRNLQRIINVALEALMDDMPFHYIVNDICRLRNFR